MPIFLFSKAEVDLSQLNEATCLIIDKAGSMALGSRCNLQARTFLDKRSLPQDDGTPLYIKDSACMANVHGITKEICTYACVYRLVR